MGDGLAGRATRRPASGEDCDVPEARGKSCVVTGAGGFIGRAVCERLVADGARVTGLDLDAAAADRVTSTGAGFAVCDTTDEKAVERELTDAQLIVHAAARVSDWGPMDDFVRVNVRGTRNVLDAARVSGAERVLHVSSVASWGYEHRRALDEDAPPRPCGIPYVDTKGASDSLARSRAATGQPVTVVRPGDVYGPGSIPWAVRPLDGIRRRQFMLVGSGEGLMTPVYVDDLVSAIVLALTAPQASGEAFTVWDGHAVSCAEFFSYYARMLGRDGVPRLPLPVAVVAGALQEAAARVTGRPPAFTRNAITFVSRRAPYSNRRARELLGWQPSVTLAEGMRRTERWFRAEGLL
jgi:nucleoside-diphosphate-sugar epimerase